LAAAASWRSSISADDFTPFVGEHLSLSAIEYSLSLCCLCCVLQPKTNNNKLTNPRWLKAVKADARLSRLAKPQMLLKWRNKKKAIKSVGTGQKKAIASAAARRKTRKTVAVFVDQTLGRQRPKLIYFFDWISRVVLKRR